MNRKNIRAGVAAVLMCGSLPLMSEASTQQSGEAAVRKSDAAWVQAARSKSVDAWLSFYEADATVMPPNDKVAHGREGARQSINDLLALPDLDISWQATQVTVARSGDIAYLTGIYAVTYKGDHGETIKDQGKLMEAWRKQADGSWKCSADIWNSDLPATGPAP